MSGMDAGMQVIDLSPLPDNAPIKMSTNTGITTSHNLWIDTDLGYAFIERSYPDNILIVDLSNPEEPIYNGSFSNNNGEN